MGWTIHHNTSGKCAGRRDQEISLVMQACRRYTSWRAQSKGVCEVGYQAMLVTKEMDGDVPWKWAGEPKDCLDEKSMRDCAWQ